MRDSGHPYDPALDDFYARDENDDIITDPDSGYPMLMDYPQIETYTGLVQVVDKQAGDDDGDAIIRTYVGFYDNGIQWAWVDEYLLYLDAYEQYLEDVANYEPPIPPETEPLPPVEPVAPVRPTAIDPVQWIADNWQLMRIAAMGDARFGTVAMTQLPTEWTAFVDAINLRYPDTGGASIASIREFIKALLQGRVLI